MKGIILAGGKGTRLYPTTIPTCKQLLPVYDKPMIYYPLSMLMLAGIREVLIISTPKDLPRFIELFGSGKRIGMSIEYKEQHTPKGIADAFLIGEEFINGKPVCLVLGDNIFYGHDMSKILTKCTHLIKGSIIFGYKVKDPKRYGIVEFNDSYMAINIEEKPEEPKSQWAIPGLYFYGDEVVDIVKNMKPSERGELEITDVNKVYLSRGKMRVETLGRGYAWFDTGTHESLQQASAFIHAIQERQGLKVACVEEIAYKMGYIDDSILMDNIDLMGDNEYGKYLREVLK